MAVSFKVDITGNKELLAQVKKITTDAKKWKAITSIYREAAKPLVKAAKQEAPVSKAIYTVKGKPKRAQDPIRHYKSKKGGKPGRARGVKNGQGTVRQTHEAGNLADSIRFFTTRKGGVLRYYVGPRVGGKARGNDGFYANFVHGENHFGGKFSKGNPFMLRALAKTGGVVRANITKRLARRIESLL